MRDLGSWVLCGKTNYNGRGRLKNAMGEWAHWVRPVFIARERERG